MVNIELQSGLSDKTLKRNKAVVEHLASAEYSEVELYQTALQYRKLKAELLSKKRSAIYAYRRDNDLLDGRMPSPADTAALSNLGGSYDQKIAELKKNWKQKHKERKCPLPSSTYSGAIGGTEQGTFLISGVSDCLFDIVRVPKLHWHKFTDSYFYHYGLSFGSLSALVGYYAYQYGTISYGKSMRTISAIGAELTYAITRVGTNSEERFPIPSAEGWFKVLSRRGFEPWLTQHKNTEPFEYSPKPVLGKIWRSALRAFLDYAEKRDIATIDTSRFSYQIPADSLLNLRSRDTAYLLSDGPLSICEDWVYTKGAFYFNIRQSGFSRYDVEHRMREYSSFGRASKSMRQAAGLIEYDISASNISIMLSVIGQRAAERDFPLLTDYVLDSSAVRQLLSSSSNVSLERIKEQIIAWTYGSKDESLIDRCEELEDYYEELTLLSSEFLSVCKKHYTDRYKYAYEYVLRKKQYEFERKKRRFGWDIEFNHNRVYIKDSSLAAHLYEMFEADIRHSMESCFEKKPLPVHDAVWSYEDIDTDVIQQQVASDTGFALQIKKTYPDALAADY